MNETGLVKVTEKIKNLAEKKNKHIHAKRLEMRRNIIWGHQQYFFDNGGACGLTWWKLWKFKIRDIEKYFDYSVYHPMVRHYINLVSLETIERWCKDYPGETGPALLAQDLNMGEVEKGKAYIAPELDKRINWYLYNELKIINTILEVCSQYEAYISGSQLSFIKE